MAQKSIINQFIPKCTLGLQQGLFLDEYTVDNVNFPFINVIPTTVDQPDNKSLWARFVRTIQPWLSALAVVIAVMSLYDSVFELVYNVNIFDCKQPSPMLQALTLVYKATDKNQLTRVSYIPILLALILQIYQASSLFMYFLAIQMGTVGRLANFSFLLLWYPILSGILTFFIFPNYYILTQRLSFQVLAIGFYQLWLVLTIKHSA